MFGNFLSIIATRYKKIQSFILDVYAKYRYDEQNMKRGAKMIPDELLEKIRKLCLELENLSQEHFDKGMKLFKASKAKNSSFKVPDVISKKEYETLLKNTEYRDAAELVSETLALLEELDKLEWIYNDKIRKLYHLKPDRPKIADDETVFSLEPPFTRSKFLN